MRFAAFLARASRSSRPRRSVRLLVPRVVRLKLVLPPSPVVTSQRSKTGYSEVESLAGGGQQLSITEAEPYCSVANPELRCDLP